MKKTKCWIEAMRLRTLPVSLAGVCAAWGLALAHGSYRVLPGVLCLVFAVLAQIASNFANEYYDYTSGRDKRGRSGPRRGVTEGDITPQAMLRATLITLGCACCVGLSLVAWSGWWLLAVGLFIAVGVFAYSTGPYPLSTHGWGEVAVIFFFGLVPVPMTFYLMTGAMTPESLMMGAALGLMGANVLIINNYRDCEEDRGVGKLTLAVCWGAASMPWLYGFNMTAAAMLTLAASGDGCWAWVPTLIYVFPCIKIIREMGRRRGAQLTPLLGATALSMFAYSIALIIRSL